MAESLTDIRIFVAAYEERSFTAAASREHATQSGVSQHIRKLEEAFGVSLFTRNKRAVVPTLAADAYYERCIQVLRTLASGKNAVKAFAGVAGDVYAGLMPTMTRADPCAFDPPCSWRSIRMSQCMSSRAIAAF